MKRSYRNAIIFLVSVFLLCIIFCPARNVCFSKDKRTVTKFHYSTFFFYRILVDMTLEDISFTPFMLYYLECSSKSHPDSNLPPRTLGLLVSALTQPHIRINHRNFHYVLDIFLQASQQDSEICQPKVNFSVLTLISAKKYPYF